MSLRLKSDVTLHTSADQSSAHQSRGPNQGTNLAAANVRATTALITDDPRQAVLDNVRVNDPSGKGEKADDLTADRITIALRDDNTVDHVLATGNVSATTVNKKSADITRVQASEVKLAFNQENEIKTAVLSGGVKLDGSGSSPMQGTAGRVVIDFGAKNQIAKVHASDNVHFEQQAKPANATTSSKNASPSQAMQLQADAMDFFLKPGNRLERAVTSGASQIVMNSEPVAGKTKTATAGSHTVITANQFEAGFALKNRIQSLHGTGGTKIVSSTPGSPDRVSTSRELTAQFDPARNGAISNVVQEGDLKYSEGSRTAMADRARFVAAEDTLSLTGSARVQDAASGLTLSADSVRLNRGTGESNAEGNVKTTYNQLKPNPNGALLASQNGDPVHATAAAMVASRNGDTAKYSGGARLWQGANIIEAPVIVFDRQRRALTASNDTFVQGRDSGVETVFVQTDKSGKTTPVAIKANKFTYSDNDRRAQFEGNVRVKSSDTSITTEHVDVLLRSKSRTASSGSTQESASQVEEIVAQGPIEIEQQNPVRKATGQKLIYTASDGKFVLTGEPGKPPSIFDAERGNITGDSLTFYTHDDRVQIGSSESSRTVTRTRIKDKSKP
jgi:lipopolysaccharide export system protein LptA